MKIVYSAITNQGDRKINEDAFGIFADESRYCFVVADGLGGHGHGDVASNITVECFEKEFRKNENISQSIFLQTCFLNAQESVSTQQKLSEGKSTMKTTCVALCINDESVTWGHIGDSRLYAFKRKRYKLRTIDHSVPQMLVNEKKIKEKEIRSHPDRNKLLKAIGSVNRQSFEMSRKYPVWEFSTYLLCSDGLWGIVKEKEMVRLLKKSKTPEQWLNSMCEIVARSDEPHKDNYTAVAVFIE